jgi:hypothetical protein
VGEDRDGVVVMMPPYDEEKWREMESVPFFQKKYGIETI